MIFIVISVQFPSTPQEKKKHAHSSDWCFQQMLHDDELNIRYFASKFESLKSELKAAQQLKWLKANIKLPSRAKKQKLPFVPDKM